MDRSPLRVLIDALDEGLDPPFEWIIAHAKDGTIRAVWNAAEEPAEIFYLYAMTHTRWEVFQAGRAMVAALVPKGRAEFGRRYAAVFDEYERWLDAAQDLAWARALGPAEDPVTIPNAPGSRVVGYLLDLWRQPDVLGAAHAFVLALGRAQRRYPVDTCVLIRAHAAAPTIEELFARVGTR